MIFVEENSSVDIYGVCFAFGAVVALPVLVRNDAVGW